MPGQVYLIQPTTLIGTKRYKIGRSAKSNLSRLKCYGKGTRCMRVYECNNPKTVEKQLIKNFRKKFNLIDDTNEYFEGNEGEMIILFDKIFNEFSTKKKDTKVQTQVQIGLNNLKISNQMQDQINVALQREKIINGSYQLSKMQNAKKKKRTIKEIRKYDGFQPIPEPGSFESMYGPQPGSIEYFRKYGKMN